MVDNVAPKQTLGKRPSMEDVMTYFKRLFALPPVHMTSCISFVFEAT